MDADRRTAWAEHAQHELRRAGHRSGGARAQVMTLLGSQKCLMSAQAIHDELRARHRAVGLASVYRALEVLANLKLVHRVEVEGTACYEPADPSGDHHHHAVCTECGQLSPFEDDTLEQVLHGLAERLGYDLDEHDVVLRGACPDCAR